jgi:uncharacterized membrane protein YfcA
LGLAEALAILAAGVGAGSINAVVGSGSLITFPTLLAFGFPPVVANVSNNLGMVPGNVSGSFGYRRELAGQRARLIRLGLISGTGSLVGAVLLLSAPPSAFQLIVPVLILLACVLVLVQPRLSAWVAARRKDRGGDGRDGDGRGGGNRGGDSRGGPVLAAGVLLSGAYGGYFGAAQGVLIIGLLGTFLDESLQRVNGAKNILVTIVNAAAAVVFVLFAHVSWPAVLLIATGSAIGGAGGARFGRRLPPTALRVIVVLIGVISSVKLIFF